jgi:geranylgeranyl pyrophosphate synthase/predicted secreted hydrolase
MLAPPRIDDAAEQARSTEARPFDWPAPGPLDLDVHDPPHASATLEWWYVNTHLEDVNGREVSLFAAFFRQLVGVDAQGTPRYAHSVSWALSEPATHYYASVVSVDSLAPELGLAKLNAGAGAADVRLTDALREVLERGRIPGPTRMFAAEALVAEGALDLDFDGNRFRRLDSGVYLLELSDAKAGIGCSLRFQPRKPPIRFGKDGVVSGVADERMFYYFIPRCEVTGSVTIHHEREIVWRGSGWYDHEFGVAPKPRPTLRAVGDESPQTSWRWASLQLDDGTDVSVYIITRGGSVLDNWTTVTDPSGGRQVFTGAELRPVRTWRSTRSFVEYPVAWALDVPSAGLHMTIDAPFPDQEVLTIISDPGFWEGRVDAKGTLRGHVVTARGWVECKGFRFDSVEAFFGAVGKEVRARLAEVLPLEPKLADAVAWSGRRGSPESSAKLSGNEPQLLAEHLVRPIREMTDRGGKAWRSYAALACIDVVGGDSRKFLHWLVIPELMHVGSLIVDDVEDKSTIRRGGPTCHVTFGEACAINAGTAAYFLAEPPLERDSISDADKLKVYRLYFDAMRAGHAGQALDLAGCHEAACLAAETGRVDALERQVLTVHRLKTALPAGTLARIGAVLGGGTAAQVEALGEFFEALGLAFQIMDDVLNLRGFENDLKERGEDIRQGKVTLPIVVGLGRATPELRRWLWQAVQQKSEDPALVAHVIAELERLGAIEACAARARDVVTTSWSRLDPLLPDSQFKIVFRAFSAFVLDRHY